MTIKRTTLITLIVVVIIVTLGASFAINNHIKERDKQHKIDEYFEYIEKQTE